MPRLHRLLVLLVALAVGVLSGVWVVQVTGVPALGGTGIGWGFLAGMLLDFVLVADFHHRPKPARVRHQ
ncbi:hypothetical protein [Nocardioides mangrovi]|uniref:Uncharacterized protein n=1 Tax=Nocardioides mangrovi TaxID=2874580 RepID=A0ABS7UJY7_9ACTN|nr:hypothetical protein [Nocardioides mangrovi]MBZ5741092.1 hypothetical protein [Nocardioides mangrovi]